MKENVIPAVKCTRIVKENQMVIKSVMVHGVGMEEGILDALLFLVRISITI